MKTAIFSVLVIMFSIVGAHALADSIDRNVQAKVLSTEDRTGSSNGLEGDGVGGVKNYNTREK